MFEIRIICTEPDADHITKALAEAFVTGPVRRHPTREGHKVRLYVTAEHQGQAGPWPSPDVAYAMAPSILSEIGWTAEQAATRAFGQLLGREFWIRKAAVLDRIALRDAEESEPNDAADAATDAAGRLLDLDSALVLWPGGYGDGPYSPDSPEAVADPRGYVRQQYATWRKQERRTEQLAAGRCPNCEWPDNDCNCAEHPDA